MFKYELEFGKVTRLDMPIDSEVLSAGFQPF